MTKRIAFVPVTLGAVVAVLVIAAGSAYLPTDSLSVSRIATDSVIDSASIDAVSAAPIAADHDGPLTPAVSPPPAPSAMMVRLQAVREYISQTQQSNRI